MTCSLEFTAPDCHGHRRT